MNPPQDRHAGPPTAEADAAALPAGHTVFEYRLEKTLGGGGFGITYLARDVNLDLPVALKEYFPGDLAVRGTDASVRMRNPESAQVYDWGLERFLDEARALASFRHPNIVRVLRYFRENGTAYIVMEYETGDPLKRWLGRQTSFNQGALLGVVYPLLDGLEAVHKTGFLHRDIKPDNIYMRADGSPVLLDFGAARRVTGERDLTNVISPGFAPFEQYHSKGNQGPWTDLYALGAVMYWMATGQKPLESASRVKLDEMPSAAQTGDGLAFSEVLLHAIDWALLPDETRRPQSVAEFRKALQGAEDVTTAPGERLLTGTRTVPDTRALAAARRAPQPASQTGPLNHPDSLRRNVLATILFLDLVGYSANSMGQQVALKTRFKELINKAIQGVPEPTRIALDTGDGAAICFLGDPEEALQSALLLRDLLQQKYGQALLVRIGMHLGPVRIMFDLNERINVVGDGINVAQRIMDFAQPNQIVVSRAYYDVISRITDNMAGMFAPLGPHLDKHMRAHEIYAVLTREVAAVQPGARMSEFDPTAPHGAAPTLSPEALSAIETDLARHIGPLARVLLKKTLPRAASAAVLREMLGASIPDAAARDAFVHATGKGQLTGAGPASQPSSRPMTQPASRSVPSSPLAGRSEARVSLYGDLPGAPTGTSRSQAMADRSVPVAGVPSMRRADMSDAQLAQLEQALSQAIGPMARMIIRKESSQHRALEPLLNALARQIDSQADRGKFLATTQKIFPRR